MMIKLDTAAVNAPATHALLISTQYQENYSFDEDGNPCEDGYFKSKGGSDYLVTGVDADASELEQQMVLDAVRDQIEWDNVASRSYIIGCRFVPASFDPAAGEDNADYVRFIRDSLIRIENPRNM